MKTLIDLIAFFAAMWGTSAYAVTPELPRAYVNTTYTAPTGGVIRVAAGGNLQTVFDAVPANSIIELPAGAVFSGNYKLSPKTAWVYVTTAGCDIKPGNRAVPADAPKMAKIQTPNAQPAITTQVGASYWRFSCVAISNSRADLDVTNLVQLQPDDVYNTVKTVADFPHHIVFDRVLMHGNPGNRVRRAMRQGGAHQALIDSSCWDIRQPGFDTQCVSDSQAPGPYKVTNNYLEATTENVAYGGSSPVFNGMIPCDIEIAGNHIRKDPAWQSIEADALGRKPLIKNWIEFKAGCRAKIENNIFENHWVQAQVGFGVVLTPSAASPNLLESEYCVHDLTFRNNKFLNSPLAINILGLGQSNFRQGSTLPRCMATRIVFDNNLFQMRGVTGNGRIIQYLSGPEDISFTRNTFDMPDGAAIIASGSTPTLNLTFQRNVAHWKNYGLYLPTGGSYPVQYGPADTLTARVSGNVFVKPAPVAALPGNRWVGTLEEALATGEGANMAELNAAVVNAIAGQTYTPPVPVPVPPAPRMVSLPASELERLISIVQSWLNK